MTTAVKTRVICDFLPQIETENGLQQIACKVVASWRVGVTLTDKRRMEEMTIWFPKMLVCNRHRLQLTPNGVLLGVGWDQIAKSVLAKGHRKPKRSYTKLCFEHLRLELR